MWQAWDGWSEADEASEHAAQGSSVGRFFRRGLLTNLLNPKAFTLSIAVLPGFLLPDHQVLPQAFGLSLFSGLIATVIHAGIVTAAQTARHALSDPRRMVQMRHTLSLMLVGVAVWGAFKSPA